MPLEFVILLVELGCRPTMPIPSPRPLPDPPSLEGLGYYLPKFETGAYIYCFAPTLLDAGM